MLAVPRSFGFEIKKVLSDRVGRTTERLRVRNGTILVARRFTTMPTENAHHQLHQAHREFTLFAAAVAT